MSPSARLEEGRAPQREASNVSSMVDKRQSAMSSSAVPEQPKTEDKSGTQSLSWHAFSLWVLVSWLAYIGVLIWLFERATDLPHDRFASHWWYRRLPDAFYTGFAQAHVPITAMHLARLGVSALHKETTSAHSWAELFWLADRTWIGPVGYTNVVSDWWSLRVNRLSKTFFFFAFTCLVALPTPYMLQRAYDEVPVDVAQNKTMILETFAPSALADVTLLSQQSAGEGAWVTGLPLTDIYNTTLFLPAESRRETRVNEFALAGALTGFVAHPISAIRIGATCSAVDVGRLSPWPNDLRDGTWSTLCNAMFGGETTFWAINELNDLDANVNTTTAYCLNYTRTTDHWLSVGIHHTAAYIAFDTIDRGNMDRGLVYCESSVELGKANADGRYGTFSSFERHALDDVLDIRPPLYAAVIDSILPFDVEPAEGNSLRGRQQQLRFRTILNLFGYTELPESVTNTTQYKPPNSTQLAEAFERGTLSMGAAIGQLAKKSNQTVQSVTEFIPSTGKRRDVPFLWGFGALLTTWFILMVYLTAHLFRKTFAPSLGSYAVGRLLAERPDLVEAHSVGELAKNRLVTAEFGRVGDTNGQGAQTGHVGPAMQDLPYIPAQASASAQVQAATLRPRLWPRLSSHKSYGPGSRPTSTTGQGYELTSPPNSPPPRLSEER